MILVKAVERVGVKQLKNNLSAYLRQVKRGVRVLVTDRDEVVAELGQPRTGPERSIHPLLAEWARDGKVRLPMSRFRRRLPRSPLKLKAGTAQRLLDEDREE
jgi:antitoxin (DNA-binding transcriptional repressor) of toxin-antitoxin stability system